MQRPKGNIPPKGREWCIFIMLLGMNFGSNDKKVDLNSPTSKNPTEQGEKESNAWT